MAVISIPLPGWNRSTAAFSMSVGAAAALFFLYFRRGARVSSAARSLTHHSSSLSSSTATPSLSSHSSSSSSYGVSSGAIAGSGAAGSGGAAPAEVTLAQAVQHLATAMQELAAAAREHTQEMKEHRLAHIAAAPGAPGTRSRPRSRASHTPRHFRSLADETDDDVFEDLPLPSDGAEGINGVAVSGGAGAGAAAHGETPTTTTGATAAAAAVPVETPVFNATAVFEQVDALRLRDDVVASRELLFSHANNFSQEDKHSYLWRRARATFDRAERETAIRKDLLVEARGYAEQAIQLSPSCSDAHKWLAISAGACAEYETLKGKLDCGQKFRAEIAEAIRLKPEDPSSHHLLGRWCLEVAALTWLEKRACAALIGTPPESSYDEALSCFIKAEELRPNFWKSNLLFVAKTYLKMGKKADARVWLEKAAALPTITLEDRKSHDEVLTLLQ